MRPIRKEMNDAFDKWETKRLWKMAEILEDNIDYYKRSLEKVISPVQITYLKDQQEICEADLNYLNIITNK